MPTEMMLRYFEKQPEKSIFTAHELYLQKFSGMTEAAFLKALERLSYKGQLIRLSKGVYCKPAQTRFGTAAAGEHEITFYFTGENHRYGFVTGYHLYNKYGLSTQISKKVEVYSKKSPAMRSTVQHIQIYKLKSFYRPNMLSMIEFLEILEHYREIEDLNQKAFMKYCSMAVKKFDENVVGKVYLQMGYKKRTLAFLKNILDIYQVSNTLKRYLNGTSKYQIPKWKTEGCFIET